MTDVSILGLPPSTYVRTALMACANKGVSHALQPVDFRSDDYAREHPFRRMPVLHHGAVKLYEALAITVYIDEAFDGPALQPKDPEGRARMLQWISATNDYFYAAIVQGCVTERFVKPMRGLAPDEEAIARTLPMIEAHLAVLEDALTGRAYFCGDHVTLADLFLAPILVYFAATPEGKARLPHLPAVQTWQARLAETPQFAEINRMGA